MYILNYYSLNKLTLILNVTLKLYIADFQWSEIYNISLKTFSGNLLLIEQKFIFTCNLE